MSLIPNLDQGKGTGVGEEYLVSSSRKRADAVTLIVGIVTELTMTTIQRDLLLLQSHHLRISTLQILLAEIQMGIYIRPSNSTLKFKV